MCARLTERLRGRPSAWDLLAPAFLAASSGFACWCSGGLETQMFVFWVFLAIDGLVAERPVRTGVSLALAAMTRPEGLLVTFAVGLFQLVRRRFRLRRDDLVLAAMFLALFAPFFAWRWWYYGWPFPNTYYVKAAGPVIGAYHERMRAIGLYYVWQFARDSGLAIAANGQVALLQMPRCRGASWCRATTRY